MEKDPALARRFRRIDVAPTDAGQTLRILQSLCPALERHHGVRILPGALDAAVRMAQRYLPERSLPDSALDLLDESAAAVSLGNGAGVDREAVAATVRRQTGIPLERTGPFWGRRRRSAPLPPPCGGAGPGSAPGTVRRRPSC